MIMKMMRYLATAIGNNDIKKEETTMDGLTSTKK